MSFFVFSNRSGGLMNRACLRITGEYCRGWPRDRIASRWITSEDRRASYIYATVEVDPSEKDTFYLIDDRAVWARVLIASGLDNRPRSRNPRGPHSSGRCGGNLANRAARVNFQPLMPRDILRQRERRCFLSGGIFYSRRGKTELVPQSIEGELFIWRLCVNPLRAWEKCRREREM